MKCCLTLGRGRPGYVASNSASRSATVMGDPKMRLDLYRTIGHAASHYTDGGKLSWPLPLPAVQHALLTSNLSCEPLPKTSKDATPERWICDSFVAALSKAMQDLDIVAKHAWRKSVPLSLRDARLFVLALLRMPKKDQTKVLSRFVDSFHAAVGGDLLNRTGTAQKSKERAASSEFLARIVTLVVAAVDSVRAGRHLLDTLSSQTGSDHYLLPSLQCATLDDEDDWYRREKSFMGLFSDWEAPGVPVPNVIDGTEPLTKAATAKLITTFLTLFAAAFRSAKDDRCHLLFSTWNALADCSAWDSKALVGSSGSVGDDDTSAKYARQLIEIREDMCAIHRRIIGSNDSVSETMLSRELVRKGDSSRYRNMSVSDILKTGMNSALEAVDEMVASLLEEEGLATPSSTSSSAALAAYEAVAVYVSFLISLHTKSEKRVTSYFGVNSEHAASRRKGSGMSDSVEEGGISSDESECDEDDEDDARTIALSRLHDACNVLGAAPIHPDWLDTSVRVQVGISPSVAADAAKSALCSLTKLAYAARIGYERSLQEALALSSNGQASSGALLDPALKLRIYNSIWKTHSDSGEKESKINALADTLGVDSALLSLIGTMDCNNKDGAREAWCPNSARRIRGAMQECGPALEGWESSNGEQRATGEWELLLSDTLLGACTSIEVPQDKVETGTHHGSTNSESVQAALIKAERWRRVILSCADALVPCTALLRLGLNCGRGRQPHPLSRMESDKDINGQPECPSSPLPDSNVVSFISVPQDEIKASVAVTVSVLGELGSESRPGERRTCRAAMCHLLADSSQVSAIENLVMIRTAFSGLNALDQAIPLSNAKKPGQYDDIVSGIVSLIETRADLVDVEKSASASPVAGKALSLLAALGLKPTVTVDTLTERQLHATELMLDGQKRLSKLWNVLDQSLLVWNRGEQVEKPLHVLLHLLFKNTLSLSEQARAKLARLLSVIVTAETTHLLTSSSVVGQSSVVLPVLSKAWGDLDHESVQAIVHNDVCLIQDSTSDKRSGSVASSKNICSMLTFLACSPATMIHGDLLLPAARAIVGSMKHWASSHDSARSEALDHQIDLLCALATRYDLLKETGTELLRLASGKKSLSQSADGTTVDTRYLWAMERFFTFAHKLYMKINKKDVDGPAALGPGGQELHGGKNSSRPEHDSDDEDRSEFYTTKSGVKVRRTCTFVDTGGEFREQHWYNCYTCGLLWDKGCCTLCALTCHRDHDVGYSRKSSFFCDCGAEAASAREQNRAACRCLSPLSSKDLATIYDVSPLNQSTGSEQGAMAVEKQHLRQVVDEKAPVGSPLMKQDFLDMIMRSSPSQVKDSLDSLVGELTSSWGKVLVEIFYECFDVWSRKVEEPSTLANFLLAAPVDTDERKDREKQARTPGLLDISSRSGKVLSLGKIQGESMVAVRAAKASAFSVKLSSDPSTDRLKRALLSKNEIKRSAVVSDSRGRFVIAEPNSLFFCTALPLVNVRFRTGSSNNLTVDRNQLCCLGSYNVNFCIVGMQYCPDNDRHLVIWGTAEASIIILSKNCDTVEKRIELVIELEPHECESEYLLKCEWLPHSETHVAAICGTFIKVFDVRRSTSSTASML